MQTRLPAAFAMCALAVVGLTGRQAVAANVAWISFHSGDNMPSAGAVGAGATTAPDKGYTDLLAAAGHTVTRILTGPAPDVANLNNNFDLVIVSRSIGSADYEPGVESAAWNGITTPMMILSGYVLRNNRLGYTTGGTIPDTGGAIKLTVNSPAHPIFAGIALDGTNTTVNDFTTGLQVWNGATMNGISINTDPITVGGTILARVNRTGDAANGGMIIGEFPAGTAMSNGTSDSLAGNRLVFLTGSRENGISAELTGLFDLTNDGAQMFRNAVTYLTGLPEPVLPKLIVNTVTGAVAIRNTQAEPLTIDYYEIGSPAGRLSTTTWSSLSDQNIDAGAAADFNNSNTVDGADLTVWKGAFGANANGDADGDGDSDGNDLMIWQRQVGQSAGPGDSWDEAGGISSNLLAELFLNGATTIAPGAQVTLGNAFVTGGAQDLTFRLARQGGNLALGTVEYVTTGPATAVPEPGTASLFLIVALTSVYRARRGCAA